MGNEASNSLCIKILYFYTLHSGGLSLQIYLIRVHQRKRKMCDLGVRLSSLSRAREQVTGKKTTAPPHLLPSNHLPVGERASLTFYSLPFPFLCWVRARAGARRIPALVLVCPNVWMSPHLPLHLLPSH